MHAGLRKTIQYSISTNETSISRELCCFKDDHGAEADRHIYFRRLYKLLPLCNIPQRPKRHEKRANELDFTATVVVHPRYSEINAVIGRPHQVDNNKRPNHLSSNNATPPLNRPIQSKRQHKQQQCASPMLPTLRQ